MILSEIPVNSFWSRKDGSDGAIQIAGHDTEADEALYVVIVAMGDAYDYTKEQFRITPTALDENWVLLD